MTTKSAFRRDGSYNNDTLSDPEVQRALSMVREAFKVLTDASYPSRDASHLLTDEVFCFSVQTRGRARRSRAASLKDRDS